MVRCSCLKLYCAILASSLAPTFARRWHLKRVFLLGLGSNLVSMALSRTQQFLYVFYKYSVWYPAICYSRTWFWIWYNSDGGQHLCGGNSTPDGWTVRYWHSNALLGAGTALAPLFVIVFVGLGAWWLLPVLWVLCL